MENNHMYFKNDSCKYFPCHPQPEGVFNCLFCYCPLYALGDRCGGNFDYVKGVKTCIDCYFPHFPGNYDAIVQKLKEINKRGQDADDK